MKIFTLLVERFLRERSLFIVYPPFLAFLPSACGRPKGIVVIQASVCPSVTHDYTVNFLTQRFRDIILGQKVAQGL